MTRNKLLAGLLLVQVGLAAITWWPTPDGPEPTPLFPFTGDQITQITIESTSTRSRGVDLSIRRVDDGWVLASGYDFPLRADKVNDLIEKLSKLRYRNPISTSPQRHLQLNVGDDKPTRRLTLRAGEEEVVLLVGAASGRRMNVRYPGQDEVYQVDGIGAWAIYDGNTQYYDRDRVHIDMSRLATVSLKTDDTAFELQRDGAEWTLTDLVPGEEMNPERVQEFLRSTTALIMSNPANPLLTTGAPSAVYTWTMEDGTTDSYRVVASTEEALLIEHAPSPPFEMPSALTREQLETTKREDFIRSSEEETP